MIAARNKILPCVPRRARPRRIISGKNASRRKLRLKTLKPEKFETERRPIEIDKAQSEVRIPAIWIRFEPCKHTQACSLPRRRAPLIEEERHIAAFRQNFPLCSEGTTGCRRTGSCSRSPARGAGSRAARQRVSWPSHSPALTVRETPPSAWGRLARLAAGDDVLPLPHRPLPHGIRHRLPFHLRATHGTHASASHTPSSARENRKKRAQAGPPRLDRVHSSHLELEEVPVVDRDAVDLAGCAEHARNGRVQSLEELQRLVLEAVGPLHHGRRLREVPVEALQHLCGEPRAGGVGCSCAFGARALRSRRSLRWA